MIGEIVGAVTSATGSTDVDGDIVTVTLPSIGRFGRFGIRLLIKLSRVVNLSFIVSLLVISPTGSIIGDSVDGRPVDLSWFLRGGREEDLDFDFEKDIRFNIVIRSKQSLPY